MSTGMVAREAGPAFPLAGSAPARRPRVKGTALAELVRATREQGAAVRERLSADALRLVENGVLSGSWYAEESLRELLEALDGGALVQCRALGAALARHDLAGVYRSLLRPGDARATLLMFPLVWSLYHDTGAAMVERVDAERLRVTLRGFALPSAALCAFTAGWIEGAAGLCAPAARARVDELACRTRGADRCVFELAVEARG